MKLLNQLRREAGIASLLSQIDTNPKVKKNGKLGVLTGVMHLAPGDMSGYETCPKRSPGCSAACLHYAGSPAYMAGKTRARIARTRLFFERRDLFMNILALEISQHIKIAGKRNMEAAIRLNGTSDIVWERKKFSIRPEVRNFLEKIGENLISCFPSTQFYDYTAIPGRVGQENYDLTFSMKEQNMKDTITARKNGLNIAAVFTGGLPQVLQIGDESLQVIDGDEHDFRPADPRDVVVGLKVKGNRGRADTSGFVLPLPSNDLEDFTLLAA